MSSDELTFRLRTQTWLGYLALASVAVAAWYFLVNTEIAMRVMRGDGLFMELMWMMMDPQDAGPYLFATFLMWSVMMIAMMVPAVIPMMIVFDKLERPGKRDRDVFGFAAGYLLAWILFSLIATVLQWGLHRLGWLGGDLLAIRPFAAASILVLAGLYQLTPIKDACLEKCRSPFGFFLSNWRDGSIGAIAMGVHHGAFCIGCCWMLMLLMFVGGTMSVLTMALLCALIVVERLLPSGPWVARLPGFGLIAGGALLLWLNA